MPIPSATPVRARPLRPSPLAPKAPNNGKPRPGYCRARDLPRLIPLWPHEIEDTSEPGRRRLIAKLRRAVREERRRGIAGHWAYDLARHAGLCDALRAELALSREAGRDARPRAARVRKA